MRDIHSEQVSQILGAQDTVIRAKANRIIMLLVLLLLVGSWEMMTSLATMTFYPLFILLKQP